MKLFDLFKAGLIETVLAVCQPFIILKTPTRDLLSRQTNDFWPKCQSKTHIHPVLSKFHEPVYVLTGRLSIQPPLPCKNVDVQPVQPEYTS